MKRFPPFQFFILKFQFIVFHQLCQVGHEWSNKASLRPLAVTFSADAQTVAAVFNNGAPRVWAVASGMPLAHATATNAIFPIAGNWTITVTAKYSEFDEVQFATNIDIR